MYTLSLLYYLSGHEYDEFHAQTYAEAFAFLTKFHVYSWYRIDSIKQINPDRTEVEISFDLNCDCYDAECDHAEDVKCTCNPEGRNYVRGDYVCVITHRTEEEFQAYQQARYNQAMQGLKNQ